MLPNSVEAWLDHHTDEMVQTLSDLIAIPSVAGKASPGAPYGETCKTALDTYTTWTEQAGCTCTNYDNRCGAAEWNAEVEPYLGILFHLDVVSVEKEQWDSPPFEATVRDGRVYGRGAIDDKGPAVSALYAMKAIKASQIPLKRGVRFIFGTDEENGSSDIVYYRQHAKMPPHVFTPDGSYPVINLEKGMLRINFHRILRDNPISCFHGGSIPNAIPAKAYAVADGGTVAYTGKEAHASTPEEGDNGITGLLEALTEHYPASFWACLSRLFPHGETTGESLGLACRDAQSGALTCALTVLHYDGETVNGTLDIRFPVSANKEEIICRITEALTLLGCKTDVVLQMDPHYTPEESPFVQTLLHVYTEQTGETARCLAIGGGTYVHDIDGGVAFGAERPGWDYHMHGANEFIPIDQLVDNAKLMAAAILALCGPDAK